MSTPVLHLLAGSNGSGKSTFAARVLLPATGLPFINADEIAAQRWPGDEAARAYDASRLAAAERMTALRERRSFITETVFSHASKVDLVTLATRGGYLTTLHVMIVPEDLAVARVAFRVGRGGHDVPEQKIRERHRRLWALVAQARAMAQHTVIYDNSLASAPFRVVARFEDGIAIDDPVRPTWAPVALTR